jgi:hypothetical protein
VGEAGTVERGADRGDLAVHHPARRDDLAARAGLRDRGGGVALERRVVVDLAGVREQAAVAVVGVLVEAQVGHDDELVADLGGDVGERQLHDARRVVGAGPARVLDLGTPNRISPPTPACAPRARPS